MTQNNERLRATWTIEAQEDINAWLPLPDDDITDRLTEELARAINEEIDREVLADLRSVINANHLIDKINVPHFLQSWRSLLKQCMNLQD